MKSLEDEEYAKLHPSFHIVPVSGLIMSTFIRLENEHKTVIELWDPKPDPNLSNNNNNNLHNSANHSNSNSNNNSLHNSNNNVDESRNLQNPLINANSSANLLEGEMYLIDFQKAVMDGKIKGAESIIEKAAKSKRFDINRTDSKYGWTALHCAAIEGQMRVCSFFSIFFINRILNFKTKIITTKIITTIINNNNK